MKVSRPDQSRLFEVRTKTHILDSRIGIWDYEIERSWGIRIGSIIHGYGSSVEIHHGPSDKPSTQDLSWLSLMNDTNEKRSLKKTGTIIGAVQDLIDKNAFITLKMVLEYAERHIQRHSIEASLAVLRASYFGREHVSSEWQKLRMRIREHFDFRSDIDRLLEGL